MTAAGLLLAAAAVFAADPAPSPLPVSAARQDILVEMRARRIIAPAALSWNPADEVLLARMRRAEVRGAFALIKADTGSLRGLAFERRDGVKRDLWLTKPGFERYQALRSQGARRFFEEAGVDAKFIFKLRDPLGKKLFTPKGILTPDGDDLYDRALDKRTVRWMDPSGKVTSDRPQ